MIEFNFATTNDEKILEVKRICANLPTKNQKIAVKKLSSSSIEEPEETGATFAENAEIKFIYYEQFSPKLEKNQFLITEDSGFEIYALENFPSVYSARFLKQFSSKLEAFSEIKNKLLAKNLPIELQKARFVCDICTRIDGEILHFHGISEGILSLTDVDDKSSKHMFELGFGYDPIFIPEDPTQENSPQTFSQMTGEKKDTLSHRAKAFKQFLNYIL